MLLLYQIILHVLERILKRTEKLIMTIDDKIRGEKLQYNINREPAKILSGNFKREYLKSEERLSPGQKRVAEQAKFTYSLFGKAFEKQIKIIEDQGRKEIDAITNQNKRLAALTNKDNHKANYNEISEELVKKRFDEIKELTNEVNHND